MHCTPGWQGDFFAAKREAIMRTLDRATQESLAGDRVAAAVTYGAATQQAQDLPRGPDARLRAKFDAVAQQLGLTAGAQRGAAAPSPVVAGYRLTRPPARPTGRQGDPVGPVRGAGRQRRAVDDG